MKHAWRAAVFVGVASYVALGAHPVAGVVAIAALFVPSVVRGPKNLELLFTILATVLAAFAGAYLASRSRDVVNSIGGSAPGALHEAVAMGALAAAASRTAWAEVRGGRAVDVAIGLALVMALGAARPASPYPFVVAAYLVAAVFALRTLDPIRARLDGHAAKWTTVAVVVALVCTWAFARVLPPLHDRAQSLAMKQFSGRATARSGFTDAVSLGAFGRITTSDAIVLRVRGASVDYLRGVVYTRYSRGRWYSRLGQDSRVEVAVAGGGDVTIDHDGAPEDRWFLPIQAQRLAVPDGRVRIYEDGIVRPDKKARATTVSFVVGAPRDVASPQDDDVAVESELRTDLHRMASAWTQNATTSRARLEALGAQLANFDYSLDLPTFEGDPIVEFLTEHRRGHCELFASSFVLLARTLDIPTRMVGGYRVKEFNSLTGHWTVRDRNAHAWVEAWVDGAWRRYDPTPPSALSRYMPAQGSAMDRVSDAIGVYAQRVGAFLVDRIVWLGPLLLVAAALFLFRRELIAWWRGRRRPSPQFVALAYDEPGAAFVSLTESLAARGIHRAENETLESFAARLAETGLSRDSDAVRNYAITRYGPRSATDRTLYL